MSTNFLNKRSKKDYIYKTENNHLQDMNKAIKDICELLIEPADNFKEENINEVANLINKYIKKYERIAYSAISNFIFSKAGDIQGTMATNLDSVVEFILSDQFKEEFKKNTIPPKRNITSDNEEANRFYEVMNRKYIDDEYSKMKISMLKLYDHVHLAIHQFENLKQSEAEFKRNFITNISPVKGDVDNQLNEFKQSMNTQLNEFTKSMTSQLISLVGIFTAMSFLVFGSINSLDDIFQNAKSIPVLQIMIIGSIWGLCISNLIFIFMFFVSKMTKLEIKSCYREDATLVQKYPLIFWSELVITVILATCSWLYYIDSQNIGKWFVNLGEKWPILISVGGFLLIGAAFLFCVSKINEKYNKCGEKPNTSSSNINNCKQKINNKSIDEDEVASTL